MKKAIITGKRQAKLVDVPDPAPRGDWALVKVHVAPLCTEWKQFVEGRPGEYLGHEAAGEVVAVDEPGHVKPGDRVVVMPQTPCGQCALCRAGDYIHCEHTLDFTAVHGSPEGSATVAQYLLKPSWLLPRIPEGVSYEHAGLACCSLGPSFGAFEKMGLSSGETVLITGIGPVGMGAVVNAQFRGARVIVVESAPWRVARAREMGIEHVLSPDAPDLAEAVRELTGGIGADCALDCSGTIGAQRTCMEATRRQGRVAFVGECFEALPVTVSPDLIRTGLTVIGSWHYNLNGYPDVMRVIEESPRIDKLISHVLPISDIQRAFELGASKETAKVIVKPWE
ncbi:MAG: zinc-binding dehydrogenase [bacterium]|nr:zinc-binding dehydrogenase [bacterium]